MRPLREKWNQGVRNTEMNVGTKNALHNIGLLVRRLAAEQDILEDTHELYKLAAEVEKYENKA